MCQSNIQVFQITVASPFGRPLETFEFFVDARLFVAFWGITLGWYPEWFWGSKHVGGKGRTGPAIHRARTGASLPQIRFCAPKILRSRPSDKDNLFLTNSFIVYTGPWKVTAGMVEIATREMSSRRQVNDSSLFFDVYWLILCRSIAIIISDLSENGNYCSGRVH